MQSRKLWRALRKSLTEGSGFQKLFKKDADIAKDLTENELAAIFNVNNLLKNLDFIFHRVLEEKEQSCLVFLSQEFGDKPIRATILE